MGSIHKRKCADCKIEKEMAPPSFSSDAVRHCDQCGNWICGDCAMQVHYDENIKCKKLASAKQITEDLIALDKGIADEKIRQETVDRLRSNGVFVTLK